MTVGVAFVTESVTLAVAIVKLVASLGVKITDRVCEPVGSTVPEAGVYANVPGTLAVALSCVSLSAVAYVIAAGVDQLIDGVLAATGGDAV